MRIRVTVRDIRKADKARDWVDDITRYCPVAQALKRTFKTNSAWWAFEGGKVGRQRWRSATPDKTGDFVHRWSFGDDVKPFSFDLVKGA
jgi:hypothetical protein